MNIDSAILNINKVICKNIDKFDDAERGILSQNILSQFRNFVEHIALKVYANGNDIVNSYGNIQKSLVYIKTRGELRFLNKLHKLLQITESHYTQDEENSERLMLKYYEYLIKIKSFLMMTYQLEVLENINDFPLNLDNQLQKYYKAIAEKIDYFEFEEEKNIRTATYYIQKNKPFFINHKVYYEVTFIPAKDKSNKSNRIIGFTDKEILDNYAVKLSTKIVSIKVLEKEMPVLMITNWQVDIRPCELRNFGKILGLSYRIERKSAEYRNLMNVLTYYQLNLVEMIDCSDEYYLFFKSKILEKGMTSQIFKILDECRAISETSKNGYNIIRYLLYIMNNKIIKQQFSNNACSYLSDLNLQFGCIPFDKIPFNTSLIGHNPKLTDLLHCLDSVNREDEFLARKIKNNIEIEGNLYTTENELSEFKDLEQLIQQYNNKLYSGHTGRKIEQYKKHFYINGYELDTLNIVRKLKELAAEGIKNYENSVNNWLDKAQHGIDCNEKKEIIKKMFQSSRVAFIYGSAGTGKSTLINHLSDFFNDKSKLYVANTHPAVDNLKRKIKASNVTFRTIASFLHSSNINTEFDILIIDECSTVSNKDMSDLLAQAKFTLLVLVGDVYQIEAIRFGNWFSVANKFIPESSVFELTTPYRSDNADLIKLWEKVRHLNGDILEFIVKNNYSKTLDESVFEKAEDDEIILCLNYDGLYGINNINNFLQQNNPSPVVRWGVQTYKIGDPVIFNEAERFSLLIYNNLKGKIVDVSRTEESILFDIEIDRVINEFDIPRYSDLELVDSPENTNSVVRFTVDKSKNIDDDDSSLTTIVPFQVAYAVSIHKAQGLEYSSVKIIITDEVEELISHNIFYTAITRAKEKLKIYWSPEIGQKMLDNMEIKNDNKDAKLLAMKL